jgi:very-short-patch-repair endonuclease
MAARINIVLGQHMKPQKLVRAKELRRHMTDEETTLWNLLRRNQLDGFHFRRQQVIQGNIADFYCHKAKLVIEVDGPIHLRSRRRDAARDQLFRDLELVVLHVTNQEICQDPQGVFDRIRRDCRQST